MGSRPCGWLTLILVLLGVAGFSTYPRRPVEYRSDRFLMDTLVSIKVYGRDDEKLRKAVAEAYAEMQRIADLTNRFPARGTAEHAASDVCRINDMAGIKPVTVDPDVFAMLERSRTWRHRTGGAFDVTIGPVMDLWGFGGKHPHVPKRDELAARLALVGSDRLLLKRRDRTAFLEKAGMGLDLGAAAKGYATEKAMRVLERNGIEKAIIDAGGTIRVLGNNAEGAPWRIGIKNPADSGGILAVLALEDSAAATSAGYFRCFDSGRKRFHHILDPGTGYPATENASVTVVAKDAGTADILSTALFVLPPERALEMVKKLDGVEVFLVTVDGRTLHGKGPAGRSVVQSAAPGHHAQSR
jgi:thiamine biosynthesis lipoprotein